MELTLKMFFNSLELNRFVIFSLYISENDDEHGPIFCVSWIHPFGCDTSSSFGRVYSRQATVSNCVKSPVSFVMKQCHSQQHSEGLQQCKSCSICPVVTVLQVVLDVVAVEYFGLLCHDKKYLS